MKNLDDFLDETGQAEAVVQPSDAGEKSSTGEVATPPPTPEPAEPEQAEVVESDDGAPPAPEDVTGLKRTLQSVRKERADYKGERDRAIGERDAMRAEIEAFRKAPPPPVAHAEPPPPQMRMPSPLDDPEGYVQYQEARVEQALFNQRLNTSEAAMRRHLGNEVVDAKIDVFKQLASANPALRHELVRQAEPYQWAIEFVQRHEAMQEIGTDPKAFRERVEAELRAKILAENGEPQSQNHQRVTLPQSLGTARSAAPRSAAVLNIPETFEDILRK